VRDIVPVSVEGRVTDVDGNPIAGVTVTIDGRTTTTGADGRYLIDEVPVGEHTAMITTPDGYTIVTSAPPFTVPEDSETPITGVDFIVAENPSLSGAVRSNGAGVAGVTVTASSPGGSVATAVTDANGQYAFPRLPAGDYTVGIEVPGGYTASSPVSREENVAEGDVVDVDFELARLGAIDGVVRTDDGTPMPGVAINVEGPDGAQQLTTDADGAYGLGTLPPGTYTITVTPAEGTTVVGAATRTVVITAAGEVVIDQDFTLAAIVVTPTPTLTPTVPAGTGGTALPATGLAPETFLWAGIGAAVLIVGGALVVLSRRRSKGD